MTAKVSTSHQIKVGIFTFAGVAIAIFSLITVGGEGVFSSKVIYKAHFDHVQGLNEGSTVSLSGIRIGNVKAFNFLPEGNKLEVVMAIDRKYMARITEGSTLDVRTQGALGDKFIFITPGTTGGSTLAENAVIPLQQAKDFIDILSSKNGEATRIFDVINEVYKMTKAINSEDRLGQMMKNFSEASRNLKETSTDAKDLISYFKDQKSTEKVANAVTKLDQILTKIDRGDGTLGALINDRSLHDSLKSMLGAQDKKNSIRSLLRSSVEEQP